MYQNSYAEVLAESSIDARATERQALELAIAKLNRARATAPGSAEELDAIEYTSRLWAAFIKDLASPGNDLPAEARAGLMKTGLGIVVEAQRIQLGLSRDLAALAEICGIVRDGLV